MKENTKGAAAKETVFPEGGPIRSASFQKASRTLYVTYQSGERMAYSPELCKANAVKSVQADVDSEYVQDAIRQAAQKRIDSEYDGEGPREVAHYVVFRPYQASAKAFT